MDAIVNKSFAMSIKFVDAMNTKNLLPDFWPSYGYS